MQIDKQLKSQTVTTSSIIFPTVITSAISLLSILIEEYGLPWLQRWLDDHRPDEDNNKMEKILEEFSRQATEENIETSDTGVVGISWKQKQDSFKTSGAEKE